MRGHMNNHHVIHYESHGDKDGNDVNMMVIKMMIVTPKGVRIARWLGQNTNKSFGILSVGILIVDILSEHSPQKACVLPGGWDSRQRCPRSRDKLLLGLPDYN